MALKGGETCERGWLKIYIAYHYRRRGFESSLVNSIHDLLMAACYLYPNNDVFSLTRCLFLNVYSHVLLIRLTTVVDHG